MIGVVHAGSGSLRRVLGLPVGVRAVLALQAAGVAQVIVVGDQRDQIIAHLAGDTRVRVGLSAETSWPAGGAVVVNDSVAVDTRAIKAVMEVGDRAAIRSESGETLVYITREAGPKEETATTVTVVRSSGVAASVKSDRDVLTATHLLLASLRKPQDGWISNALNRRISLAFSRWLAWTPIRPNQLSIVILAIGLYGAWLASLGTRSGLAWGGVLFQMQSVLDGCDGELSRLTFRGSRLGEWLDTVGDDLTNYSFFAGAAWGVHQMGFGSIPLWLGAIGVTIGVFTSGIEYAYLIRIGSGDLLKYPLGFGNDPSPTVSTSPVAKLLGAIRPAFKRDFFVFIAMVAAMVGPIPTIAMLTAFVGGAIATCGAVLASEFRRRRAS